MLTQRLSNRRPHAGKAQCRIVVADNDMEVILATAGPWSSARDVPVATRARNAMASAHRLVKRECLPLIALSHWAMPTERYKNERDRSRNQPSRSRKALPIFPRPRKVFGWTFL